MIENSMKTYSQKINPKCCENGAPEAPKMLPKSTLGATKLSLKMFPGTQGPQNTFQGPQNAEK